MLERAILEGLLEVLRKPTKIKAEVTESMDYKPVIRWTDRKQLVETCEPFGTGGRPGISVRIREQARDKGRKCIVHGCDAESVADIELYSIGEKVRVCEFHSDLLKQLDGDAIYEAVHLGHVETSSMGRIVAYEEVFPDFDDGTPPATQAAMRVSDGALIRHFELLEAGYVLIASEGDDGRLEIEWLDPYVVIPYQVELEELIVGEIMTALAPYEHPDFHHWALHQEDKNKKEDDI